MATLTALKPTPFVIPLKSTVELELTLALASDLKVYDSSVDRNVFRYGMIYWLRSSATGEFEQTPRILTVNSNLEEFRKWFGFDMIYIAVSNFSE